MTASRTDSKKDSKRERIFIFVRHGESEANARRMLSSANEGWPLTGRGREQAEEAARVIAALPRIDKLYASPVIRARQTAEIIGKGIGFEPILDERLRERHMGILEEKIMPYVANDGWKFDSKNRVQPWEELKKNMASFIQDAKGDIVVAVTHGDNMSVVCDLMDNRGEKFHAPKCPRNCHFVIADILNGRIVARDVKEMPGELIERIR